MHKHTRTIVAILLSCTLVAGAFILRSTSPKNNSNDTASAYLENGVQYIDILAQGGYTPRIVQAKAGIPTVLRMETKNTYDCSIALVIPDIGYRSFLEKTGVEEIEIPLDKTHGTLRGLCSMAMYHFEIVFE